MTTETVEQFLARGGKVQKSNTEVSLDELLYNEGILDHSDAESVKDSLGKALNTSLDEQFNSKKQ